MSANVASRLNIFNHYLAFCSLILTTLFPVDLICELCSSVKGSKYQLKLHYFYKHFYKKISAKFPRDQKQCPACSQQFCSKTVFLKHYGMKHNEVETFLTQYLQSGARYNEA